MVPIFLFFVFFLAALFFCFFTQNEGIRNFESFELFYLLP